MNFQQQTNRSSRKRGGKRSKRSRKSKRTQPTLSINPTSPPERWGNAELKMAQLNLPASVSSTPSVFDMTSNIAIGAQFYNNRIGNAISPKFLTVNGNLVGGQVDGIADDTRNTFRMVVALGTPGLAFAGLAPGSLLITRIMSGLKKVLYDKEYSLESPGRDTVGYMPAQRSITFTVPLQQVLSFTGNAAGTVSCLTYYLVMVSDSGTVPNPGFTNGSATMFFTDH